MQGRHLSISQGLGTHSCLCLGSLTQALTCGHVHEYTVPQLHEEDTGLPLAISIKHMKMDRPFELGKLIFNGTMEYYTNPGRDFGSAAGLVLNIMPFGDALECFEQK